MDGTQYNSFDAFLKHRGTSFLELMRESELSRPSIYLANLAPVAKESSSVKLREYFIDKHNISIPHLLDSLLTWNQTIRGEAFWQYAHEAWSNYATITNTDNLPIFSIVNTYELGSIKDDIVGLSDSVELSRI